MMVEERGRGTKLMEEVSRRLDLLGLGLVEVGRSGMKRPVISGPFKNPLCTSDNTGSTLYLCLKGCLYLEHERLR